MVNIQQNLLTLLNFSECVKEVFSFTKFMKVIIIIKLILHQNFNPCRPVFLCWQLVQDFNNAFAK